MSRLDDRVDALAGRIDDMQAGREVRRAFRLRRASDLEIRPASWSIRGVLELDALALTFGDPGCGKSFLAVDWALSIASGTEWQGRRVKQSPVIYIAGEGHNGLTRRLKAWSIRQGVDLAGVPLFVSDAPAAFTDPAVIAEVEATINDLADQHGVPGLVVLDTVARNFGGGDENSTRDMGQFIQSCDRIRAAYRCTVLLVHHTGHADKSRARGAMALKGALDIEYRLDKDESGVIRLEATKMKDGPHPEPMAFRLRTVDLGITDDEGESVTSAVLDSTSYEPPSVKGKVGRGKWQTLALEVLSDLHSTRRATLEAGGYDSDGARVSVDDWRMACGARDVPRQRFYQLRDSLATNGFIRMENGYVWPS
ncbi:MAG: helicase RepA family protein [FCB group bacterium]|nr:helicase RepA family protein [FCB group bacterium]